MLPAGGGGVPTAIRRGGWDLCNVDKLKALEK